MGLPARHEDFCLRRFLILLTLLTFVGCGGSSEPAAPTSPSPTPAPPTGPATLQTVDLVTGTGEEATGSRTVVVHYTLWLYDPAGPDTKGAAIESSRNAGQPFSFRLGTNAVIPGFEQGVTGMRVGGVRRVTIPPSLGYGAVANGPIPANSWLVFEIELLASVA